MYEYICKVVLDNQEDEIKTFANSTLEAFDNLVSMSGVTDIFSVVNKETDELFTFDGDMMALKEARGNIKDEHLIIEELYRLDGTEKRNSLN
tara:strand:- start:1171 stop:1446 length:276 start_codon:yes stop_codon:yes gene_type:complete